LAESRDQSDVITYRSTLAPGLSIIALPMLFALALLLLPVAVWINRSKLGIAFGEPEILLAAAVGLMGLALGVIFVRRYRSLLRNKPTLTLSAAGLRHDPATTTIPWPDIRQIDLKGARSPWRARPSVDLRLDKPRKFLVSKRSVVARGYWAKLVRGGHCLRLFISGMSDKPVNIYAAIIEHWRKYK